MTFGRAASSCNPHAVQSHASVAIPTVCYDVNTTDLAGQKRLRKVAKACEAYGQRVQKSVFECRLTETQLEKLKMRLLRIIDPQKDSLRFYRLPGEREPWVEVYGLDHYEDFDAPLVI